jgi:hypothetical protein
MAARTAGHTRKTGNCLEANPAPATNSNEAIRLLAAWHLPKLLFKIGQRCLHRLPHRVEIDLEVAVRHAVAHASHLRPWYFWMGGSEVGIFIHHACRSFANGNEIENDGRLGTAVRADPNTWGLRARLPSTRRRTSSRCSAKALDGCMTMRS